MITAGVAPFVCRKTSPPKKAGGGREFVFMKSSLFYFSTLSPHRIDAIKSCDGVLNGSYTHDFRNVTAESLFAASKGYTLEELKFFCGKFVIMESFATTGDNGDLVCRMRPIPEQFNEAGARLARSGSFSYTALANRFRRPYCNDLFSCVAICLTCGATFYTESDARRHVCGEKRCGNCRNVIRDKKEIAAGYCITCATARARQLYSYHSRPHRNAPIFQYPDKRAARLHIGAEIEVTGDNGDAFSQRESARNFSDILNVDPFKPFAEFETDGSIDDGVEVITAPTTWDGYKNRAEILDTFYKTAKADGGTFDKKNGLHFHIDRDYFQTDDEDNPAKAAVLLDLLFYKYFDFFAAICRRRHDCFYYASKKDGVKSLFTAATLNRLQDHTHAVNGGGRNTIEIRVFGGAIASADDFFAALDIVQAAARWAKNAKFSTAETATPTAIIKYLKDPANVKRFCTHARPSRPQSVAGEAMRAEFITAIDNTIKA